MANTTTVTVSQAGKVTDILTTTGITLSGPTYSFIGGVISVPLYSPSKYPGIELKISGNKTLLIKQL